MSSKSLAVLGAKNTPDTENLPLRHIMGRITSKLVQERSWIIHTNGDKGATEYFEAPLGSESHGLKRFLPYHGYNSHEDGLVQADQGLLLRAKEILVEHSVYPVTPRFMEPGCSEDLTQEEAELSRLHSRLVFQVLGENLDSPVTMLVCWTPDGAIDQSSVKYDVTGSSGIAISLASSLKIPVFNLERPDHLKRICTFIGESVPSV